MTKSSKLATEIDRRPVRLGHLNLGFVSDFEIRASDLEAIQGIGCENA
jgi:hypothetical protein